MASSGLWLRWSLRDLRRRWLLVTAISLVLALGIGMFAALGSTAQWRRASNDLSFAAVAFHDLRVVVAEGQTVPVGGLTDLAGSIEHAEWIVATEERLRVATQVEAVGPEGPVLVRGELVAYDLDDGGSTVDRVHVFEGSPLEAGGRAVLEAKFADEYGLPTTGRVMLSGDSELAYAGLGVGPEEFIVIGDEAGLLGHRNWATVYVALSEVPAALGGPAQVNELVVRLADDADPLVVAAELQSAAEAVGIAVTVDDRQDVRAFRTLYDDIENDEKVWNVIGALVLAGAVFATFNLVSRTIDAQRREIGVGMALGVRPQYLALRPLLLGVQVGVLGLVLGVAVGLLMGAGMQALLEGFVPLPVWSFDFQWGEYLRAVVLGLALPVAAAALPVWRAVRVEPVDAITTVHARSGAGLLGRLGRIRLPGRSLGQLPVRNLLRRPRRALLTALAVAAAITTLVAVLGMLDSVLRTLDDVEDEALQGSEDRLDVLLARFVPVAGPELAGVTAVVPPGAAAAGVQVGMTVTSADDPAGEPLTLLTRFIDLGSGPWTPTVTATSDATPVDTGIVLSEEAAGDLGVRPGDEVVVRHPLLTGQGAGLGTSRLLVSGLHPDPIRAYAYIDLARADLLGAEGVRNLVQLVPDDGTDVDALRRELFANPDVAATQSIRAVNEAVEDGVDELTGFLQIVQIGILVLALLIAYNASSISTEERAREHATMFAFGVRVRSVILVNMAESGIIGVVATAIGLAAGYGLLTWIVEVLLDDTFPELGIVVFLSTTTVIAAVALGVAVVAAAPVLTIRRLTRMEVADTLRVME